jgi:hypothetical protein
MVVVEDYSVAEPPLSMSTSSPLFSSSLSRKFASSLSTKLNSASSVSTKLASSSKKPTLSVFRKQALSNGWVEIRRSLAQLHRTMEAKAKENSLQNSAMSPATRLLAAQKDKPKSERLDSTKVVDIINEEIKSTLNSLTIHQYVNQGHIGCGCLQQGQRGTVVDDGTYVFLLEAYITHCQLLQANGRKEPNLKNLITQTKIAIKLEKNLFFTGCVSMQLEHIKQASSMTKKLVKLLRLRL